MMLERLKELATSGERMEGENLGEFCDRWHAENGEIREALPALLEVAEAARGFKASPKALGHVETPSEIRLYAALAKLEEGGRTDEAS